MDLRGILNSQRESTLNRRIRKLKQESKEENSGGKISRNFSSRGESLKCESITLFNRL